MEAIELLAQPEGNISRNWLMIMDNADNIGVDIREFFPECDHGAILITTRNPALGNLSQGGFISLDVMSREEGLELLLGTALGPSTRHANSGRLIKGTSFEERSTENDIVSAVPESTMRYTENDRRHAIEIVELLGFLPVAIVQAGCYIRMQKCLPEYANRFRTSRAKILQKPAPSQRDRLKYKHSVYATFDTTVGVLSLATLQLLSILSFIHFLDFPRPLISVAASYDFEYEPQDLLKRDNDYNIVVDLLRTMFCPSGKWDEDVLDQMLEELQQYSMITLVPVYSTVTFRFHPLLHAWAKDRLSPEEAVTFHGAAIRLLVCGTNPDDDYLWEYLLPHFKYISPFDSDVHVNDRGALANVVRQLMDPHRLVQLWEDVYSRVKKVHGENHIQTSQAFLELADAYGMNNQWEKVEPMKREVVKIRLELLGEEHPLTLYATSSLARTLRPRGEYEAAAELEIKVIDSLRKAKDGDRRKLVRALTDLAITRTAQAQYDAAITLMNEALDLITALVGQAHPATIVVMEHLLQCYSEQGNVARVEQLGKEVQTLKTQLYGNRHAKTLDAITSLALAYTSQGKHTEAEAHWREVLEGRRETLGNHHVSTLNTMFMWAEAMFELKKYAKAGEVWAEELVSRRKVHGNNHKDTLDAMYWVARCLFERGEHAAAESLWREELSGRRRIENDLYTNSLDALHWLGLVLLMLLKSPLSLIILPIDAQSMPRIGIQKQKRCGERRLLAGRSLSETTM